MQCISWCPRNDEDILSACVDNLIVLMQSGTNIARLFNTMDTTSDDKAMLESHTWKLIREHKVVTIQQDDSTAQVVWHKQGDYFASLTSRSSAITMHRLTTQSSQILFNGKRAAVHELDFHPTLPLLLMCTTSSVFMFDLKKQSLIKKLQPNVRTIVSMALHPSGDHLIVGSGDGRLSWFDLSSPSTPAKVIRSQTRIQKVTFHNSYPLFATSSSDNTIHIFHASVSTSCDTMVTDICIVPVRILRWQENGSLGGWGTPQCIFHPSQPWLFAFGTGNTIGLFRD